MQPKSIVISFALLFAGSVNLVLAQHSGGHASGHVSSGHSGFSSGFHARSVAPATTPSVLSQHNPRPGQLTYPTPFELQPQHSGMIGINPGVLNNGSIYGTYPYGTYGRGYNRGYRGGVGFLYPPYYISTIDEGDNFASYPYAYNQPQDQSAQNEAVTANLLGQQINQLSAEVDALRSERENESYPAGPVRPPYNAPPALQQDQTPASPPLTLVLSDGKQIELRSYAVMGQNFWDFSEQPAKRIPLSAIDLNASKTATEAKGGEFPAL